MPGKKPAVPASLLEKCWGETYGNGIPSGKFTQIFPIYKKIHKRFRGLDNICPTEDTKPREAAQNHLFMAIKNWASKR